MALRLSFGALLMVPCLLVSQARAQSMVSSKDCPGELREITTADGKRFWVCAVPALPVAPTSEPTAPSEGRFAPLRPMLPVVGGSADAPAPAPSLSPSAAVEPPANPPAPRAADASLDESSDPSPTQQRWYGAPILAVDVVSTGMALTALSTRPSSQSDSWAAWSYPGYLLGGPIVHISHRNWGKGFASLGFRFGGLLVGALVGAAGQTAIDNNGDSIVTAGVGAGCIGAMTLDQLLLAHGSSRHRRVQSSWAPSLNVTQRTAQIGFQGTF